MAKIKGIAWRVRDGNNDVFQYRVQVENIDFRSKSKVLAAFDGWRLVGEILDPRVNTHGLVFAQAFLNAADWLAFARGVPYPLAELSSTSDRVKPLKLGTASKGAKTATSTRAGARSKGRAKRKRRKGGNACGKCGRKGHNARTCTEPAPKVRLKRKKTTCSRCGDIGHNVRTCKLDAAALEAKLSRRKRCGHCGEIGHNKRTCPELV